MLNTDIVIIHFKLIYFALITMNGLWKFRLLTNFIADHCVLTESWKQNHYRLQLYS